MQRDGWDSDFQLEAVRRPLTRNIAGKFDEVIDEIRAAFSDTVEMYSTSGDDGTFPNTPTAISKDCHGHRMVSNSRYSYYGRHRCSG